MVRTTWSTSIVLAGCMRCTRLYFDYEAAPYDDKLPTGPDIIDVCLHLYLYTLRNRALTKVVVGQHR